MDLFVGRKIQSLYVGCSVEYERYLPIRGEGTFMGRKLQGKVSEVEGDFYPKRGVEVFMGRKLQEKVSENE